MTHQVIVLSDFQRPEVGDADAPFSRATRGTTFAQTGTPVALTVALRYLAGRRTLLRAAGGGTPGHD